MNKLDLMKKRNDIARLVRENNRCGSFRNHFRFGSGGYRHELKKFDICYSLHLTNKEFLTEARFKDYSGIADILVLDDGIVYEIMNSETEKKLSNKIARYPKELELKKLNKSLVVKMPAVGEPPFKEVSVFWLLNNNLEEIHKEIKHYDKRFETSFGIHEINQNQIKSFINNRFEVIMANIESLIKIN